MRNSQKIPRRLIALLLSVFVLAACTIPAAAAGSASQKTDDPVVLTVCEQTAGADAVAVKTYTASALAALAATGKAGYQYWKGDTEYAVVATQYVALGSLLADAGVSFGAGDTCTAAASDLTSSLTYEDSESCKYYVNGTGSTEVPAALALTWASGSGTLDELAASAANTGSIRFCYGISQQQYTDKSAKGKRLTANVTSVTIVHPEPTALTVYEQGEGTEATAVKTYTASALAALATTGKAGYQYWKGDTEYAVVATQYVTLGSLLTDAGVSFGAGDTCTAAASDLTSSLTYEDSESCKYYVNGTGSTEVPAALALTWASGSGTLDELAASAVSTGNLRFCYGISQQEYTDKSAKGRRLVSNVTSVTVTHACPGRNFTDMPPFTNWAHAGIDFVVSHGLFTGTTTTTFSPAKAMTRAMLVTVLWQMGGKPEAKQKADFSDVEAGAYYEKAVAWAAENGIVNGIGNGKFNPKGLVTREQLSLILFRYAENKGYDTKKTADITGFPDYRNVSKYARTSLAWANAWGLISGTASGGKTLLDPKGSATRAQVAAILMQFDRNVAVTQIG